MTLRIKTTPGLMRRWSGGLADPRRRAPAPFAVARRPRLSATLPAPPPLSALAGRRAPFGLHTPWRAAPPVEARPRPWLAYRLLRPGLASRAATGPLSSLAHPPAAAGPAGSTGLLHRLDAEWAAGPAGPGVAPRGQAAPGACEPAPGPAPAAADQANAAPDPGAPPGPSSPGRVRGPGGPGHPPATGGSAGPEGRQGRLSAPAPSPPAAPPRAPSRGAERGYASPPPVSARQIALGAPLRGAMPGPPERGPDESFSHDAQGLLPPPHSVRPAPWRGALAVPVLRDEMGLGAGAPPPIVRPRHEGGARSSLAPGGARAPVRTPAPQLAARPAALAGPRGLAPAAPGPRPRSGRALDPAAQSPAHRIAGGPATITRALTLRAQGGLSRTVVPAQPPPGADAAGPAGQAPGGLRRLVPPLPDVEGGRPLSLSGQPGAGPLQMHGAPAVHGPVAGPRPLAQRTAGAPAQRPGPRPPGAGAARLVAAPSAPGDGLARPPRRPRARPQAGPAHPAEVRQAWPVLEALRPISAPGGELPALQVLHSMPLGQRRQGLAALEALPALGGGEPLPPAVRRPMERGLGRSLAGVRIYTAPAAAQLGAEAFTTGERVVFAPGRLDLRSRRGLALLSHELAHLGQPLGFKRLSSAGPAPEDEAERVAVAQEALVERIFARGWPGGQLMELRRSAPAGAGADRPALGPAGRAPGLEFVQRSVDRAGGGGAAGAPAGAALPLARISGAAAGAEPPGAGAGAPDPEALARQVYTLLKARLWAERDRHCRAGG